MSEGAPAFARRDGVQLGELYCLSNPAMPGLYKIGYTLRRAQARSLELYDGWQDDRVTGVPLPFVVIGVWEFLADEVEAIEQGVHRHLHHIRVNPNREFFRFESDGQAVDAIEQALAAMERLADASLSARAKLEARIERENNRRAEAEAAAQRDRKEAIVRTAERTLLNQISKERASARHDAGRTRALLGAVGGLVVAGMLGTDKIGAWALLAALGAFVGWITGTDDDNAYLQSDAYKQRLRQAINAALAADSFPAPPAQTQEPAATPAPSSSVRGAFQVRCPNCWGVWGWVNEGANPLLTCRSCRMEFSASKRAPVSGRPNRGSL